MQREDSSGNGDGLCMLGQTNTLKTTEASFLSVRKRNYKTGKGRKLKPCSVELELEESL